MQDIQPCLLKGSIVELEPLNESHKADLFVAAQDEAIWSFIGAHAFGEKFEPWFAKVMKHFEEKHQIPFVVRRLADHKIVGSTRYYDIRPEHNRVTIGYTWYIPEVWGTAVNPECKFLLFQYAFETIGVNRVEFATDSRNLRSIAAIKKLGATEEGVLRKHMVLEDGYVRDTVMLSVIQPEWQQVKLNLQSRLAAFTT